MFLQIEESRGKSLFIMYKFYIEKSSTSINGTMNLPHITI